MVLFPLLEAAFGLCVGCRLFAVLMRLGLVPEEVCLDCADITRRRAPQPHASPLTSAGRHTPDVRRPVGAAQPARSRARKPRIASRGLSRSSGPCVKAATS